MRTSTPFLLAAALCFGAVSVSAEDKVHTDGGTIDPTKSDAFFKKPGYSPYAGRTFPTRVWWGEQHLHTSWSGDAGGAGTRVGPDAALRLAKGEEITSNTGQPVKLGRPLDWLVIADHSDGLGIVTEVIGGNPKLMTDPIVKRWNKQMNAGGSEAMAAVMELVTLQSQGKLPEVIMDPVFAFDMWKKMTANVEQHNEPNRFTAFIGYEWTSNYGGGNNLHRNIIYRGNKAEADQVAPLTTFETEDPENLWKWMAAYEEKTGGSLLAIPHNGNLSNGLMFSVETIKGEPVTREYAETRARWEPLFEVTQGKGTSEQHPSLSPNDEFADFEIWDKGNLNLVPKKPGMISHEYAREALKNGLALQEKLGANPFQFGLVGSTDSHTGLTTAEENNFFGKFPTSEPSPERWSENAFDFNGRTVKGWELGASGYTGIWATENTREALWDAMKRKEVYGTTGPRITVRFFGGFDFVAEDAHTREPGAVGYAKGVPMGGDLQQAPEGKAPSFLVGALKDAYSGNLDRIQIIKGWVDDAGKTQERIYDVAVSAGRAIGEDGRCKEPVGNTVDAKRAIWTNTIGAPELITVWQDPDFDPTKPAFYYARVIEIPTPRWTTYDAVKFGLDLPKEIPVSIQERAYTSPIWYTP